MAVTLDQLKLNLRIDGNEDDSLLKNELMAAQEFVRNAVCGGSAPDLAQQFLEQDSVVPLVDNAVLALASTYYQNRESVSNLQSYEVDAPMNSIIGSLRGKWDIYCEEVNDNAQNQSSKATPTA